jgi:hypothetical protein
MTSGPFPKDPAIQYSTFREFRAHPFAQFDEAVDGTELRNAMRTPFLPDSKGAIHGPQHGRWHWPHV